MSRKRHRQAIAAMALKEKLLEEMLNHRFKKRARMLALAGGDLPSPMLSRRARLYNRSQHCHWCKQPLAFEEATIEHLVRLADGGTNAMSNTTIACGPCNWSRGTETDPEKVVEKSRRWKIAQELKRESIYTIDKV